jgi:hypothetical protein
MFSLFSLFMAPMLCFSLDLIQENQIQPILFLPTLPSFPNKNLKGKLENTLICGMYPVP